MRRLALSIISLIMAIALVSCSHSFPEEDTGNVSGYHTIRYDLGDTASFFTSVPSEAEAGNTVEIRTGVLYDADIHLYVDGQEIEKSHFDSDYWGYSFVMPERDVTVTASFYSKTEIWGTQPADEVALREKYPEYFDLSTFKGLEVYVWQMAESAYRFGVMEGTNRSKTLDELLNLKGASAGEMRAILSSYGISEDDVSIIPIQHPLSSYITDCFIIEADEDEASVEKKKQAYIERIREMLFSPQVSAPEE